MALNSSFFTRLSRSAQNVANGSNGNNGVQIFGGKFSKIEESVSNLADGILCSDGLRRKPVAACVIETQSVDRYGSPFVRKDVRVYLENPNGKVDGVFASYRLNPDSTLRPGQWLDVNSLQSYKCERAGVEQPGNYADAKATDAEPSKDILTAIGFLK